MTTYTEGADWAVCPPTSVVLEAGSVVSVSVNVMVAGGLELVVGIICELVCSLVFFMSPCDLFEDLEATRPEILGRVKRLHEILTDVKRFTKFWRM